MAGLGPAQPVRLFFTLWYLEGHYQLFRVLLGYFGVVLRPENVLGLSIYTDIFQFVFFVFRLFDFLGQFEPFGVLSGHFYVEVGPKNFFWA